MSKQYCPECGHENPGDARFCMACGFHLAGDPAPPARSWSQAPPRNEGTDWASIVAAILAFLSLRRFSRKSQGLVILIVFFILFFGCPMVCGLMGFVTESFSRLFQ